jgi:hypothetical protein
MVGRPRPAPIPVELAVRRLDGQVVDAGMAEAHQAVLVKLPVLVSVGSDPVAGIVVKLIGEADGDSISGKGPEFLNKAIIDFPDPFAGQKFDDLRPALKELAPIPPTAVGRVDKRDAFRITTILPILGRAYLLYRSLAREWGQRGAIGRHINSSTWY